MTAENPAPNPAPDPEDATGPDTAAAPEPEAGATASPSASAEAWNDVVSRMGELATAVTAWARSAADDPQNKARLEQVRAGVDEMARQADAAFGKVASSDFGQQVTQGAQQAGDAFGDAAQQVSEAAAPHVATALSGLAGVFGRAAAKVDEAVNRDRSAAPAAPGEPAPTPQAPAPEPPPEDADQG